MNDLEEDPVEEKTYLNGMPHDFRPRIFEGNAEGFIPSGFEAVTIVLNGRMQADLDWKIPRKLAQQAHEKGYAIMWDMQLGLFEELEQPLASQAQFLSLALSLEHFRDSLWKEFKECTLGLSLFRGTVDFSQGFPWDSHQEDNLKEWLKERGDTAPSFLTFSGPLQEVEERLLVRLFCRDVALEYLSLLARRLPDSLAVSLYLDAAPLADSLIGEMQLLNPASYEGFQLALRSQKLPFEAWGWGVPSVYGYSGPFSADIPPASPIAIGICVPPFAYCHPRNYEGFERCLLALKTAGVPFKLIGEDHLTSSWDGLDYLLYNPLGLSAQGRRKLQGFCAAGGTVVSTGDLMGFSYELSMADWLAGCLTTPRG